MEQEVMGASGKPDRATRASTETASSLGHSAGIPSADLTDEIDDFCRAVLAGNRPRGDEPFATIARYLLRAVSIGRRAGRLSV